ncbi:MAG: BMP family protein [Nitrospinota bacterium]
MKKTAWWKILAVLLGVLLVNSPAWAQKIKVAGVLPATVKDLSWNAAAQTGLKRIEKKFGVKTSMTEMVSEADAERVIRDYANQGYNLIICHSFNFQDACLRVAKDFPNTNFANMSGFKTAPNMIACDWLGHESGYLAGVIAGLMTKTNRAGVIGGFAVPDVVRIHEGFKLGIKAVNPGVEVFTTYPGSWRDSSKGLEAALAMIENKADVILSIGDGMTVGAMKAAEQKRVMAIGSIGDLHPLAPKTILTSVVYNIPGTIEILTERTLKGTFKKGSRFLALGLKRKGTFLAPYRGNVPANVAKKVEEFREKIVSGGLKVPKIDKPPKK